MRDHRRMGQAQVGAALLVGDDRMHPGQPADVRLVDHGLVVGGARRPVQVPVEVRVHHHRARDVRRGVGVVPPVRMPELVREHGLAPGDLALDRLGVRVDQQLVRVAALPLGRVVRAVHPVPVPLPWADAGQVPVPDEPVHLVQVDPRLGAVVVEQAELNPVGYLGEQPEVGPGSVIRGTQRVAVARPYGSRRQMFPHPSRCTCVPTYSHFPTSAASMRPLPRYLHARPSRAADADTRDCSSVFVVRAAKTDERSPSRGWHRGFVAAARVNGRGAPRRGRG